MPGPSLLDCLSGQLVRLCGIAALDPAAPLEMLTDLLGAHGARPLSEPPAWPSEVADDHTPVEFSVAYAAGGPPALRILGEVLGAPPDARTNLAATFRFIDKYTGRYALSTSRMDSVRELFAVEDPRGAFALWCSLVFRNGRQPEVKVYFNPEVRGTSRAPRLVAEALHRLGLGASYQAMVDHAVRPGELGRNDRLTFFALDLHDGPDARIKLYLTHHDADVPDVLRAASLVDGVDLDHLVEFLAAAGDGRFDRRPLVGSYTFSPGAMRPTGYSVYLPIRSYVDDDEQARDRVGRLLALFGHGDTDVDRAVDAVARRPLRDGVGLIAHVSLRLGVPRPGMTVYLSAEAYRVTPPRSRRKADRSAGTAV